MLRHEVVACRQLDLAELLVGEGLDRLAEAIALAHPHLDERHDRPVFADQVDLAEATGVVAEDDFVAVLLLEELGGAPLGRVTDGATQTLLLLADTSRLAGAIAEV